jgi:hypothetical protein
MNFVTEGLKKLYSAWLEGAESMGMAKAYYFGHIDSDENN